MIYTRLKDHAINSHNKKLSVVACAFADFESIHAEAYARLNEELGLDDFEAFMEDEEAKAKIDRLVELPGETLNEKALSLAIFSAFTEGVNLFSSFAILMSFQLRNLMKGTGQIVEYSVRDESLHSKAGCWLFRRYKITKSLKERLILNHIILLNNVFGPKVTARILFYKIDDRDYDILKTFLAYLDIAPDVVYGIRGKNIHVSEIPLEPNVAEILLKI